MPSIRSNFICIIIYNNISISVYSENWNEFYFKVELDKGLFYGIINKDKENRSFYNAGKKPGGYKTEKLLKNDRGMPAFGGKHQ